MCEISFHLKVFYKQQVQHFTLTRAWISWRNNREMMMVEVWIVLPLCLTMSSCLLHNMLKNALFQDTLCTSKHRTRTQPLINQLHFLHMFLISSVVLNDIIISIQFLVLFSVRIGFQFRICIQFHTEGYIFLCYSTFNLISFQSKV